jgi:cytochrome c553
VKTEARCSSVSLAMRVHLAVPFGSEIGQVRIDAMSEAITVFKWLIIANAVIGINACASAQDNDVGKTEYLSSCGACHGIDAKGNGPVSKELKTHPTDLTVLAKNNTVYEMIDGRNFSIASHGTREMPIWGYRFTPPQAFRFKNRILAVIDYLNRIQEK